ncbi:MAG: hypothetical protein ACYDBB_14085 [Armatimonadota bacterium]
MRIGSLHGWQVLAVLLLLVGVMLPANAQRGRTPREDTLNGISLDVDSLEVLNRMGMPQYLGPAVGGVDAIQDILDPPPVAEMMMGNAAGAPGMPGAPVGPPPPQLEKQYIVWMYDNAPRTQIPGTTTYVIFNKQGKVVGVVVSLTKNLPQPFLATKAGIGFGSRLTEVVNADKYGWPSPFAKVGPHYFLSYPDRNITFGLDATTRRVVVIAIGLPFTVIPMQEKDANTPGGGAPGLPGMRPMPY